MESYLLTSVIGFLRNYPSAHPSNLLVRQDTEKLVAFLFGVTSHMVADVSWHSLGIEQGFLRAMGAVSTCRQLVTLGGGGTAQG